MTIDQTIKQLDDLHLYEITGADWHIHVSHTLTEPTCPTVTIQPEGWHLTRYRYDRNTIMEGVAAAVEHVRTEIGDKRVLGIAAPFTNGDDAIYEKWLRGYVEGKADKLPEPTPERLPKTDIGRLVETLRQLDEQVTSGKRSYESAFGYMRATLEGELRHGFSMTPTEAEEFEKQLRSSGLEDFTDA